MRRQVRFRPEEDCRQFRERESVLLRTNASGLQVKAVLGKTNPCAPTFFGSRSYRQLFSPRTPDRLELSLKTREATRPFRRPSSRTLSTSNTAGWRWVEGAPIYELDLRDACDARCRLHPTISGARHESDGRRFSQTPVDLEAAAEIADAAWFQRVRGILLPILWPPAP